MRPTLTLDDDPAAKLKAEQSRAGLPFKEVINETLRRGLASRQASAPLAFKVTARDLGALRPGLSLDDIGKLIEQTEGSLCSRGR